MHAMICFSGCICADKTINRITMIFCSISFMPTPVASRLPEDCPTSIDLSRTKTERIRDWKIPKTNCPEKTYHLKKSRALFVNRRFWMNRMCLGRFLQRLQCYLDRTFELSVMTGMPVHRQPIHLDIRRDAMILNIPNSFLRIVEGTVGRAHSSAIAQLG